MKCSCTAKTLRAENYEGSIVLVLRCYFCGKLVDTLFIPKTEEAFRAIKEATQYIPNDVEGDTVEQDKLEETDV
jgi:hypothetical protein